MTDLSTLSDADLMHMAVYADTPLKRDTAIRAWGRRQFAAGMRSASQVHSHVVDMDIRRQRVNA